MDPCILVIFGGTGDLTRRKLYPALCNLYREGLLPEGFAVVSVGRRDLSSEQVRETIMDSINEFSRQPCSCNLKELEQSFLNRFHYYKLDFADSTGYGHLKDFLEELDQEYNTAGNRVFFLAVAPEYFSEISNDLHNHNMVINNGSWQRVVIEKPFGQDLDSALVLNAELRKTFGEQNIYRIDHYLGKEMAQSIMVMRFANAFFEPIWNNKYIDHVQISICETDGIGTRGGYYEQSGALRDMVQNHMMQLLTLVAMEPPVDLSTEAIRDEKVKVLRSLSVKREDVVRGQYGEGIVDGQRLKAYRDEDKVAPDSNMETFAALKVFIENFRWAQVPFYLRTGKRLPHKYAEILIKFKKIPNVLYFKDSSLNPNILTIRVQPDEGIFLKFNTKNPGPGQTIIPVSMDFYQHEIDGFNSPEAYERLLHDVMRGDSTLFTRWDEVEYSWRFVDQIERWWHTSNEPIPIYASGTWGPKEADLLMKNDGREWFGPTKN